MNTTDDKYIVIGEDAYYKIVVLEPEEFKTSMFYNCFEKAERNLIEIVEAATSKDNTEIKTKNKFKAMADMNNIIAFVGGRGTGKTSTMLSFAGALEDEKYVTDSLKRWKSEENDDVKFKVLDVIDPMMIGKNESILQIIIAKLFSEFKESIKSDSEASYSQNRDILESFNKIFSNLKILYSNDLMKSVDTYDSLEALNSLAVGVNMKHMIKELVSKLLKKYMSCNKKSFLVIPIDDLDLTISKTEDMIEEIRKYLIIPNVVILLSANMDQLSDSIEQMFVREYKDLLADKRNESESNLGFRMIPTNILHESSDIMASRYLEKLFPLNRRIYMPRI